MKLLIFSDSHGDEAAMRHALAAHPDADEVIHLGDGVAEALRLAAEDGKRRWTVVRGNCDYDRRVDAVATVSYGGKRFYLTHGYRERVKSSLLTLALTARSEEAAVALYGHTHAPATDFDSGILLFNPGSIGAGSYGVITVTGGDIYSDHYRVR